MISGLFRGRPMVVASALVLLLVFAAALFGPLLAPYDPYLINHLAVNQGSSAAHLLGTDEFGRDILSRLF